jgi:hypothetical protein
MSPQLYVAVREGDAMPSSSCEISLDVVVEYPLISQRANLADIAVGIGNAFVNLS